MKEESVPPYYPYPEVIYSLNAANYSSGIHNITVVAIDKANNSQETSIIVDIEDVAIVGFQITTLFTGNSTRSYYGCYNVR